MSKHWFLTNVLLRKYIVMISSKVEQATLQGQQVWQANTWPDRGNFLNLCFLELQAQKHMGMHPVPANQLMSWRNIEHHIFQVYDQHAGSPKFEIWAPASILPTATEGCSRRHYYSASRLTAASAKASAKATACPVWLCCVTASCQALGTNSSQESWSNPSQQQSLS